MGKRITFGLFSVLSLTAYCALSVWPFGSLAAFFSNPARVAYIVAVYAAGIAAAFTDSSGVGAGVREDKSNRWVFIPLLGVGSLEAWLPAYMDAHNIWVTGGDGVRWFGVVLTVLGAIIRLVPVFELGRRFSGVVAIQEGHTLKTDGIYSTIRHPSYLGLITVSLGCSVVFRGVIVGVIITAIIAATLVFRMNSEEKLLTDQFKDEYIQYKQRTWRLIPHVY